MRAKSKLLLVAIAAILATVLTQPSLAYYTTIGIATNVVTSGEIRLKIHEKTADGSTFPEEGVYIMPGDIVSKQVSVENVCDHPFYLRVKMVYGIDSETLPYEDCFKLNVDESNWLLHDDGWYYYNGIVEPEATTPAVFSHVEIVGKEVDNDYIGKTLSLTVVAQAVQSENNPLTDGKFHTASGWPAE